MFNVRLLIFHKYYTSYPHVRPCSSSCSVTKSYLTFVTPWTAAYQASLSFTIFWRLSIGSIGSVIPSKHLFLCHPLLLLPLIFPSMSECLLQWIISWNWEAKVLGFSISTSLNIQGWFPLELTGFISFNPRDTQEYFQHHCVKTSVVQCSDFFMVHTHIRTWLLEIPYLWIYSHSFRKVMSLAL